MYEKKTIHSQRKDKKWSSDATAPGSARSTEPKQNTFGIFLNSKPATQTHLQRPLISKNKPKMPRIYQNNDFMWKTKITPNPQNWGVSQTSTKISILYVKTKPTTRGSRIYLQFHRVTPEVAGICLESGGPSGFSKILQNYNFSSEKDLNSNSGVKTLEKTHIFGLKTCQKLVNMGGGNRPKKL